MRTHFACGALVAALMAPGSAFPSTDSDTAQFKAGLTATKTQYEPRTQNLHTPPNGVLERAGSQPRTAAPAAALPPAGPIQVEVDQSNAYVVQARYETTPGGIEVEGRIAKRWDRRGRILGHVAITLLDAHGQVLAHRQAALQGFGPSPKNPHWATFATRIEPLPAGVSGLCVAYERAG